MPGHRKTHGAEGGAGKTAGPFWRRRRALSASFCAGSKSWIFRFWIAERDPMTGEFVRDPATKKVRGRSREMGLGSFVTVSLAEARDRARNAASSAKKISIRSRRARPRDGKRRWSAQSR